MIPEWLSTLRSSDAWCLKEQSGNILSNFVVPWSTCTRRESCTEVCEQFNMNTRLAQYSDDLKVVWLSTGLVFSKFGIQMIWNPDNKSMFQVFLGYLELCFRSVLFSSLHKSQGGFVNINQCEINNWKDYKNTLLAKLTNHLKIISNGLFCCVFLSINGLY